MRMYQIETLFLILVSSLCHWCMHTKRLFVYVLAYTCMDKSSINTINVHFIGIRFNMKTR